MSDFVAAKILQDEIATLRAENEKLRQELQFALDHRWNWPEWETRAEKLLAEGEQG